MANIKIIEKSGMNDNSHFMVKGFFLSKAPKISRLPAYRVNIAYHANSVELLDQLERIDTDLRL